MGWLRAIVLGILGRYGASLRFPILFFAVACLFAFNLVLPDPVPFIDELILALMALMLASFKRKPLPSPRDPSEPIDVTDAVERLDDPH